MKKEKIIELVKRFLIAGNITIFDGNCSYWDYKYAKKQKSSAKKQIKY